MPHTITGRVIRTFLSLLALWAAGAAPVLSAALPGVAFARKLLPLAEPHNDNTAEQPWRYLDRPNDRPGGAGLGPFVAADFPAAPPATTQVRTFIEEMAGRIDGRAPDGCPLIVHSTEMDSDHYQSCTRLVPTWSNVWSDGAPLLLFNWSDDRSETAAPRGLRFDGPHRVATGKADADWADLSSKVKFRERDDPLDPSLRNAWETDETVKMSVAGPLFLFGQLGASSPSVEQQQLKWLGKTGVGVKLKPGLVEEVQLRGGPAVRYDDTSSATRGQLPERSEVFLEAVTKVPLPGVGPLNVEYTGYAVPPAAAGDHNQFNQDVKLAMPLSGGGQFHVGAKYKWENAAGATPWVDRMQVYMGVQLKR
jgi:hypothetical protein